MNIFVWRTLSDYRPVFPSILTHITLFCVCFRRRLPRAFPPPSRALQARSCIVSSPFRTEFSDLLGPTDPCPTAVHMEPFSTSVYKVLICILATTTKICTKGSSTRGRPQSFNATDASVYSSGPGTSHALPRRLGMSGTLQRHPFSGLVDSAGELLHTP